ncbi:NAD(P)-dependent oxidoreductase [Streptomyces sp. VRA16 Mangrove soil]|uniref:NAD(P)-dependent oxidoreductase n=1 Tax=Streptomyces sp. VRA16 Mangrove soil TaxID=2817434 RepID=UPI001A9DD066|nr:NAD(P)H-binding protein [Streptomyces sp. VRA16 Mangrove soil]MBO1330703.1 NAD(P)H-binding protein [Streptomyces sp. VRA16 Mangrove soil]
MHIAVLGASGKAGRLLVAQAVERGHQVTALVRAPEQFDAPASELLDVARADVMSPDACPDLSRFDATVSAIGISKGDGPGALVAGARLLAAAGVRTVWLGALGTGVSTGAGGRLYQAIMQKVVGKEMQERTEADRIAQDAGATVFHAPDLWVGSVSPKRRLVPLADVERPVLPPHISRATLAALMLDEAEKGRHSGEIVVPLS